MSETWWLAEGADPILAAHGLTGVGACTRARGESVSQDRSSAALRLDGTPTLLLKWRRPRPGRVGRTAWRASNERKEAVAALRAQERGVPVPTPLAVGERRRGPFLVGAALVRPWIDGVRRADRVLAEDAAALDPLLVALAGWHDTGFRHGGAYPKNVLLPIDGTPPIPIGCPAATFRAPGPHLDRARAKDLAQWAAGLAAEGPEAPDADPLHFLETYAAAARMPVAPLTARVRLLFASIQERKARRWATLAEREPFGPPPPTPLPPDATPRRVRALPLGRLVSPPTPRT